ncbi:hypothetical protein [Glycomyces sp. NPDC047010]|uniref:hypothetical protein n=1 Tax=Glycomyces sp. NPDC047010 TaxID=3155023 RepID=UPI0033D9AD3B
MKQGKHWAAVVLGVLLALMGSVWFLQGIDVAQGSPMTGVTLWAIVGPVVAVIGLAVLVVGIVGLARRRRADD